MKSFATILLTIIAIVTVLQKSYSQVQTRKGKMKEYILINRMPLTYGAEQAAVREEWTTLINEWRANGTFVASFIFPVEGYLITGEKMVVTREALVSRETKVISNIVINAESIEKAIELAKLCPILKQGANIEIHEVQPRPQAATPSPQIADTSLETKNTRLIRSLYEDILNPRKYELLKGAISDEYIGVGGVKGLEGFIGPTLSVINGFPDIKWTIDDILADGDKVVVRWHWNGTNTGSFRGIPASNKAVTDNANVIYQLKDGKIVHAWVQGDRLGVLTQIGAIPADLIPSMPGTKPKN